MRPIATVQDTVQFPLNELLGTAGNVRLLRLLATEVAGPVGTPDAAEQTGLTEAGARRALRKLVRTGFVEEIGGGRAQRFRLREDPLTEHIRGLFRAEKDRYRRLIRSLREVLGGFPEIHTAWVDVPPTKLGQPMHIGVLSDSRSLTYLDEQLRRRISEIESEFELTIELRTFSRADLPDVAWQDTELLVGHLEEGPIHGGVTHPERAERSLRISQYIADLAKRDPTLIARAQRYVSFLLEEDHGSASHDLGEWLNILERYSPHRLGEFLRSDTPRAQRLRQSSPFFAVLSAEEREDLLDQLGEEQ